MVYPKGKAPRSKGRFVLDFVQNAEVAEIRSEWPTPRGALRSAAPIRKRPGRLCPKVVEIRFGNLNDRSPIALLYLMIWGGSKWPMRLSPRLQRKSR